VKKARVRLSCLAGSWYSGNAKSLTNEIEQLFKGPLGPGSLPSLTDSEDSKLVGIIIPHAGYQYSGQAAAWAFSEAAKYGQKDTIVIIGPNHRGLGSPIAISNVEKWSTPLGETEVDSGLVKEIVRKSAFVEMDDSGHAMEHSIEIQLPFIQYLYGGTKIVPIISYVQDFETSVRLGKTLADTIKDRKILIIASSDMTHYLPANIVIERDNETLSAVLAMDERSVWEKALRLESFCGLDAVVAMMSAAKSLGSRSARVLCHYTSGDVTENQNSVVGYASVAFYF